MRFSEVEQDDKLEWLIRKDGCMHCADPGCLKACPAEGAIIQQVEAVRPSTMPKHSSRTVRPREIRARKMLIWMA